MSNNLSNRLWPAISTDDHLVVFDNNEHAIRVSVGGRPPSPWRGGRLASPWHKELDATRLTLEASLDHGTVARTLDQEVGTARRQFDELAAAGIDLAQVTDELEREGVANFAKSYRHLVDVMNGSEAAVKR